MSVPAGLVEAGLSSTEAAERLARFGPNVPTLHRRRWLLLEFLARCRNPLVLLLLTASAVWLHPKSIRVHVPILLRAESYRARASLVQDAVLRIPPSTAEGDEQRHRVLQTLGLSADPCDRRLVVLDVSDEYGDVTSHTCSVVHVGQP